MSEFTWSAYYKSFDHSPHFYAKITCDLPGDKRLGEWRVCFLIVPGTDDYVRFAKSLEYYRYTPMKMRDELSRFREGGACERWWSPEAAEQAVDAVAECWGITITESWYSWAMPIMGDGDVTLSDFTPIEADTWLRQDRTLYTP